MNNPTQKSGLVALIGRPNAGKSTLMNRVLDQTISIVTPKAQTTRERVLGILTEEKGQILFLDTPGIHKAKAGGINELMVHEARMALDEPNAIWYLVDPGSALEHEMTVLDLVIQATESEAPARPPLFLLMNKADRFKNPVLLEILAKELTARGYAPTGQMEVSAIKGRGVSELLEQTWNLIPEGQPFYPDSDQLSDRPTRFFVAEKIRERLFYLLGEELPYSCAIQIEKFDEASKPPRIEANICVERDSQKGMVIGKGGAKIKEIGISARQEIETFLGHSVFLGLKVKVLKEWTRNPAELKSMGYTLPNARPQNSTKRKSG